MRCRAVAVVSAVVFFGFAAGAGAQWNGAASPHDGRHLVVVRPGDLRTADALAAKAVQDPAAAFESAVPLIAPLEAKLAVRHEGEYVVWLRASYRDQRPLPVKFSLKQEKQELLAGNLAERKPAAVDGGYTGYAAYAAEAQKSLPGAKTGEGLVASEDQKDDGRDDLAGDAAEFEQELLDDIAKTKGEKQKQSWVHFTRLEAAQGERPYYWWRLGALKLEPGTYSLQLAAAGSFKPADAPAIDCAFLSTSDEVVYPFRADVSAPPATYIRFRLDTLPEEGVSIQAGMRIHYDPWSTASGWLNPGGMGNAKAVPHTKAGYTAWYRLQDLENAPPFGASEAHLLLTINRGKPKAKGATQFAVYPHDDYVLREIDWDVPESSRLTFVTDVETYPERLRTFRDHARENYDRAIAATGDRLFPLTRGELRFTNAWGYDDGDSAPYMVKTLRLLGINCAGNSFNPVLSRKLYGWSSHAGEYWPPAYMPFDEKKSLAEYAKFYKNHFDGQRELYEGVSVFQIADEPGEISREEMSSPLWRFRKDQAGEKYMDVVGGSWLATRKVDFPACVVEGVVEKHGGWVGFRAGTDHATAPKRFVEWRIGKVTFSDELNVATTRAGLPNSGEGLMASRSGVVVATGTPFKIVFQPPAAALFLNGKLIQTQGQLPAKGGFAIVGPPKAVRELRLREIAKGEEVAAADDPDVKVEVREKLADLEDLEELTGEKTAPDWAQEKPLRKTLKEDWIVGGGMPEAQDGFRRWAQEQGLKPELFGHKSWDEVRMLTVPDLVETPADARLFYWSRRYSGYLTPRMFAMAADAIQAAAPNPKMVGFVALSGHAIYFPSALPLDMFQLASGSRAMLPGISDWMSEGGWRWDSHQAVAYSVAMYNAGARQYGKEPLSYPMMHCVWPSEFRAYTQLANNVRFLSFYNFGPYYQVTEGFWSDSDDSYHAVHKATNRTAQVDDVLANARMRPSRVAMLYSMSNEYWNPQSSFADKRASFLGLSHEYYQPELVTEDQVAAGALEHYDALYLLEPRVAEQASEKIAAWVRGGGLLWACADAGLRNEFNEPADLLAKLTSIKRREKPQPKAAAEDEETSSVDPTAKRKIAASEAEAPLTVSPAGGKTKFRKHTVNTYGMPASIEAGKAAVRAKYDNGRPAWLEEKAGKGKVVYIGHRAGLTYTSQAACRGGFPVIWADTGRELLTKPLHETQVDRELTLSEPLVMASPMSAEHGTVVILYNMRPNELKKLEVSLKEEKKPISVEYFVGDKLVPLPFKFDSGRVTFTLPSLETGQMVLVRRTPQPADERLAEMKAKAEEQLGSDDWQTLSAAAWTAGFHADWKLESKLLPLLAHEHWEVRRCAVEALGRLRAASAADGLAKLIAKEKDSHVHGDALVALARIGDERFEELAIAALEHADPFVRKQAIAATNEYLAGRAGTSSKTATLAAAKFALQVADIALADRDSRVRLPAIALVGRYDAQRALATAINASDPVAPMHRDLKAWAEAVADNDVAFASYLEDNMPGGDAVLLPIAARRADQRLAAELTKRAADLIQGDGSALVWPAIRQRDPALSRELLKLRKDLPPGLENALPIILEKTFDARLGAMYDDWAAWLNR